MIIKESEAKEKYCPFGKADAEYVEKCDGEKCMAWKALHGEDEGRGYCRLIEKDSI